MTDPIRITPDRATYIRSHAWMAALGMGGGMLVLWLLGNPHVWTGAIGGLAAIVIRGWYMASEELAALWVVQKGHVLGPMDRKIALTDIAGMRSLMGNVQIITHGGDKHLIKYQSDPDATIALIESARR
jgi:hypothetical protein